eukprot:scaffold1697_cov120-Cylindrotheca_fusiformis.AAC.43
MAQSRIMRSIVSGLILSGMSKAFVPKTSHRFQHRSIQLVSLASKPRSKGEDRATEFSTLAENLKLSPENLKKVLIQKRSKMSDNGEKAKYIDWLLAKPKATQKVQKEQQEPKTKQKNLQHNEQPSFLSTDSFADCKDLHPASKRALLEVLKVTTMTEIQSRTFAAASSGRDCLGRARTGTGKTLAFLVPALERLLQLPPMDDRVGILIISPTRELATQIADQAEKLLTFHKDMNVQVVFGGTKLQRDMSQFNRKIPTILVATPGRLLDHLESTEIRGKKFGRDIMSNTPLVVLDETDRLLDMGFRRERDKRQTLLFSATLPKELKGIMAENMKPDFIEVDCINDGDAHTNSNVQESHVVVPSMDRYVSSVVEIVRLAMEPNEDPKIVVFFPTARLVAFFSELFNEYLGIPVIELHSKKSQGYRNRASEQFRSASSGVLFTSDVSARGVDYPGVTQVIQFGMPDNREQYIHRLGRTGRAGKAGEGWLVLGPFESFFLQELKGMDIPRNDALLALLSNPIASDTNDMLTAATDRIRSSRKRQSSAKSAYQAFLGFYLGKMKMMKMNKKDDLVAIANIFSGQLGLPEVPRLTKQLVGKMGLKGVRGIYIADKIDGDTDRPRHSRASVNQRNHSNGRQNRRY